MTDLSWLPGTAAGTFVLLSAGGLAYGGETGIAIGLVVLVVVGWTVAGTYPYWFSWITTRRYPDTFNREIVTRLEDDGLHAEFGASSSFRAWSDMSDFIEDGHYIVIRNPNRLPVAFVPKRCFDSEADLGRFRTLLAAHVKQALA